MRAKPRVPRATVERARAVDAVFTRAAHRRVFGFGSGRPSGERVFWGKVPADFDFLCVEGDAEWTRIPDAATGGG